MWIEIPYSLVRKADPDALASILRVDPGTTLELDFKELASTNVIRNEIGALPVVGESHGCKTILGKNRRHYLEIVVLLLSGVE